MNRVKRILSALVILFTIHYSLFISSVAAQEVTVNVMPVQRILPPQVMLYINNPGNYFNVQLINNSQVTQNVYIAMRVEQILPSTGLHVIVPAKRQPQTPFTVAPGQVRQLTMVELKNMFNHVVKSEVQTTPGLFDSYTDGTFGLLPEGQYEACLTAYKWDPALANPVPVSNPMTGKCQFTVCYKAQAPQFILPMAIGKGLNDLNVAKLSRQNPQLTWREPVLACNPKAQRYTYDIKIVEMMPGQQPDDAMDFNPAVYLQRGIMTPVATIPKVALDRMKKDKTYLVQVTARTSGSAARMLNYTLIENEGKSPYRMFRVVDSEFETPKKKDDGKPKDQDKKDPGDSGNPEVPVDTGGAGGDGEDTGGEKESTILYKFRVPTLKEPTFEEGMARKSFVGEDIDVEWRRPQFIDGKGARQDTVKFSYTVELFQSKIDVDKEEAFKGKAIYSKTFKNDDDDCTIPWTDLSSKTIRAGDYLILRVTAKSTNEKSIEFVDGKNIVDFAIAEHLAKSYFQCSDRVEITNTTPTTASDSQLKGKTVGIGQYQLTLDEIKKVSGRDYYEGKGHVEWRPMGFKVMVAVKFDSLKINSDNIVYGGRAVTYQSEAEKQESNSEVVDKLFSDWGIDNLIGDTGIPYSAEIQQKATDEVKNIAEKLNVSKYYQYVKKGKAVWNQFLKGEISDLHLPVALPKDINPTPADVQIVSMKFSPTHATMDVLGEFALPNSKYYENDILLLGAPRLCISPEDLLPESGTLALLGNFTLNDPESSFDFTFKAPTNVLEPTNGCFVSWHDNKFEVFDIDVDMKIPGLVKVDNSGNRTTEHPILNFQANIANGWDDWFAKVKMDNFEAEDLQDWTFVPGGMMVYDHSKYRNADGMKLPVGYDKTKIGLAASDLDAAWQGMYIEKMGIVFPKMLKITDEGKNWNGRLKLQGNEMFFDASGCSLQFGASKIFDIKTGSIGGWGISMNELKLDVLQNAFQKAYFNGEIKTPLEGQIGYTCNIYAQGKDQNGKPDPNRTAYIFKTQQVDGLGFDFWGGAQLTVDKEQTYFLVEAETIRSTKKTTTKVELCIGAGLDINIGRDWLKKKGKVGAKLSTYLPRISVAGMRIANCERWKSHYTQNQYEAPDKGQGLGANEFFGWKTEYNIKTDNFYFSLGRWSLSTTGNNKSSAYVPRGNLSDDDWLLAQNNHGPMPEMYNVQDVQGSTSTQGKLGPFDFNLHDFKFDYNKSSKVVTLTVGGGISLMGGVLKADADVNLLATANIDKLSFAYKDVKFGSASFKSGFGGCTIEGTLAAATGDDEGYEGTFKFGMPGDLFKIDLKGAYKKRTDGGDVVPWGYFEGEIGGAGVRVDPIVLKAIKGGFYFNCTAKKTYKKDTYGGMFGMKICTSGGENLINADMDLTVVWDNASKSLSSIIMNGKLEAAKGLVKSEATLAYKNENQVKTIELDISVKSCIDSKNITSMNKAFQNFSGKAFSAGKAISQGLGGLTKDEQDSQSEDKASKKGSSKKSSGTFSAGKLNMTLNFKVTMKKNQKTKWHLYIGEPDWNKRCSFTLIDFQVGSRAIGKFGAWAYLACNGYVCLGNEMPSGGLPDPPPAIQEFLYGGSKSKDVNGKTQNKKSEIQKAKDNTLKALSAEADGGFMFGAGSEGDFGVNAGIVYAMGMYCVGFDVLLKHFANGAKCQGGGKMGYHDFYGLGQVYGMLKGEMGVQLNLWFWKGRCSLIDVGLGALVQGGMPNPTWIYGKVKAKCKLLGGLFKFNKSVEFKAGKVCMPDYGDPLDNIEMFSNVEPGVKNNATEGYKKVVSPDLRPIFTTNYAMNHEVRLVDENMAQSGDGASYSERIYKFTIKNCEIIATGGGDKSQLNLGYETTDQENFQINNVPFKANNTYYIHLTGKAWERINGKWGNPKIDGSTKKEKLDEVKYYFKTGQRADDIISNIVMTNCGTGELKAARKAEFARPQLWLNCQRDDLAGSGVNMNNKGYEFRWVLYVNGKIEEWKNNEVYRRANCECWRPAEMFWKVYGNDNYRISLVRFKKGMAESELWRKVQSQKQTKNIKSKKESNSNMNSASSSSYKKTSGSYFGATSNPIGEMNNFFANEEKEVKADNHDETYNKMTTSLANSTALEMWSASCSGKNLSGLSFSYNGRSDLDDIYECERVFMTVKDVDIPTKPAFSGRSPQVSDWNMLSWSYYKKDPYIAMAYLTKFMFLGGKTIKSYAYSDKTDNAQRGLNLTLMYPEIRGYQDGHIDGLFEYSNIKSAATSYYFSRLYDEKMPGVLHNGLGYGYQWGYDDSSIRYSYDKFELSPAEKRNKKIENTYIHQIFLRASLSDAYGMRDLTKHINACASQMYNTGIAYKNFRNSKDGWVKHKVPKEKEVIKAIKEDLTEVNDNTVHDWTMNGGGGGYKAHFDYGGPADQPFNTFNYQMGTQSHFIWQLCESALIQGISNYNVPNYPNDNMRHQLQWTVWNDMKNWTFDPTAYLKSIRSVTYELWLADYYDFVRRRFRMTNNSGNVRTVKVNYPFSKLQSVY